MLQKVTLPLLAFVIVLVLVIATFGGCAGPKSPSASVSTPANVSGTWQGGTATGASMVTMILKQSGTAVTGSLTGAGTLDGPIEGTVDGDTIRLREQSGYGSTPLLTVRGDQMSGTIRGTTLSLRRVK